MEALSLTVAMLLARRVIGGVGNLTGEVLSGLTDKLAELVKGHFHDDEEATRAWESVRRDPHDEEHITTLASHVDHHLSLDEEFTRSVREVVAQAEENPKSRQVVMMIKDNASVGKIGNFGVVKGDVSF